MTNLPGAILGVHRFRSRIRLHLIRISRGARLFRQCAQPAVIVYRTMARRNAVPPIAKNSDLLLCQPLN
jgi:hypothetical protein